LLRALFFTGLSWYLPLLKASCYPLPCRFHAACGISFPQTLSSHRQLALAVSAGEAGCLRFFQVSFQSPCSNCLSDTHLFARAVPVKSPHVCCSGVCWLPFLFFSPPNIQSGVADEKGFICSNPLLKRRIRRFSRIEDTLAHFSRFLGDNAGCGLVDDALSWSPSRNRMSFLTSDHPLAKPSHFLRTPRSPRQSVVWHALTLPHPLIDQMKI